MRFILHSQEFCHMPPTLLNKSNCVWEWLPKSHSEVVQNGLAQYQVNSCTHMYIYSPLTWNSMSVIRAAYLLGTSFKCSARTRLDYWIFYERIPCTSNIEKMTYLNITSTSLNIWFRVHKLLIAELWSLFSILLYIMKDHEQLEWYINDK